MRALLVKLGYTKSIIFFTLFSVVSSIALTAMLMSLINRPLVPTDGYIISALYPLLIAPVILHLILKLIFDLNGQEQQMRQYAQKDTLTNFLTRRAWFEFAEQYEIISKRQNRTFTLLMLDLDNFKKVNDDYGHIAGDAVIKSFSEITRFIARDSDIIGRFGGEEFIFLLPDTNAEQAYSLCERLHHQIRNTVVDFNGHELTFTTSIGLACQTENHGHSLDYLISLADKALYTAKSRGKNCSFLHREQTSNKTSSYAS